MRPVILFVFAGRQPNLELQIPMVQRILAEHPTVEYHVWNFARNDADRAFIKTIAGERTTVFNGPAATGYESPIPTGVDGAMQFGANEHNAAYNHYADKRFGEHLFVKLDDDIVFLETARFGKFVEAIDTHRGSSLVANIVNNGACTPLIPGIWDGFTRLRVPLLDIHMSNAYAEMCHTFIHTHPEKVLDQPIELVPTEDWLSINAVGYSWSFLRYILATIGTRHPPYLAGRNMRGWGKRFGDEGVFQTQRRIVMKGFTAAHVSFGPQDPTDEQLTRWRARYAALAANYLAAEHPDPGPLPELSKPLCAHVGQRGHGNYSRVTRNIHRQGRHVVRR